MTTKDQPQPTINQEVSSSTNKVAPDKTNTLSIVGFILAFFIPLVGLILSIVSLPQISKKKEGGKGLAIAGIVISVILLPFHLLFFIVFLIALTNPNYKASTNTQKQETQDVSNKATSDTEVQKENPQPEYIFIKTIDITPIRQERHSSYNRSEKPTEDQVKTIIITLAKECPSGKICDVMLWDSKSSFDKRDNTSNQSNNYSRNNAAHLVGYRNSGGLFYYYGSGENYLDI